MEAGRSDEVVISRAALRKSDLHASPVEQFRHWFHDASKLEGQDATAMTLATADRTGRPSARVVLLKAFDEEGFSFFTNYNSRKSRELIENPRAMLVFWWEELARQVRIAGSVHRLDAAASDEYFQSRPRGSQLGAWASPQSQVIADRSQLEQQLRDVQERFGDGPITRPDHWGGFRLVPEEFEFWLGGMNRLHDRFRYRRNDGSWVIERLAP